MEKLDEVYSKANVLTKGKYIHINSLFVDLVLYCIKVLIKTSCNGRTGYLYWVPKRKTNQNEVVLNTF